MTGPGRPAAACSVVTGAFGYSGKYIAARLLAAGERVRTLTNSPERRNPFGPAVEAHPYNFDRPDALARHGAVRVGRRAPGVARPPVFERARAAARPAA